MWGWHGVHDAVGMVHIMKLNIQNGWRQEGKWGMSKWSPVPLFAHCKCIERVPLLIQSVHPFLLAVLSVVCSRKSTEGRMCPSHLAGAESLALPSVPPVEYSHVTCAPIALNWVEAVVSIKEKSHAVNEHKCYGWCTGQLQPYRDITLTIICKIRQMRNFLSLYLVTSVVI